MKQALEIALFVAARAEDYDPPVEPPRYLLPFSNFSKPVPRALKAAFRALEEDDEFRRRVAEDLDVDDVGRPSWLFLHRPDGWQEELASIEAERDERRGEAKQAVEENRAARRLREVEAELERAKAELTDAQVALAREREQRAAAAAADAALRKELDSTKQAYEAATAKTHRAEADRAEAEAALTELREELAETKAALARAAVVDVDLVRRSLADAALSLKSASAAVDHALASVPAETSPAPKPRSKAKRAPAPRRRALPLPGGILDDSPEAAEHLVRAGDALLLVDGYNATQWAWEGVPIAEQRDRLVAALCELHARTGISVSVVFDGDGPELTESPATPGQPVRVTFTSAEVEADDVIIDRAVALPPNLAVIVASNDNRVRDACAACGANLLTIEQLMAALRR